MTPRTITIAEIETRLREAGEVERSMAAPRAPGHLRATHPPIEKTAQEARDGLWALIRTDIAGNPVKAADGTYLTDWDPSWTKAQPADRAAIDRYGETLEWLAALGQHNPRWRIAVWTCHAMGFPPQMASTRMVPTLWRHGLITRRKPPDRKTVRQWRDDGLRWIAQHLACPVKKGTYIRA